MNDTQAGSQIANTLFPPPPEYYKKFSDANVARYEHLSSTGAGPSRSPTGGEDLTGRAQLTSEDAAELEELSRSLEKPRADWIREEGRWVSFGEMSMTTPHIPGPADIGLTPLFDPDQESSLTPLLHSFLHTLLRLIDTLTNSARPPHELAERGWAHEGDQYIQHMTNLSANMMVAANSLRGMQAQATLVLLMEKQLAARREQTAALRSKCQTISNRIRAIRLDPTGEPLLADNGMEIG